MLRRNAGPVLSMRGLRKTYAVGDVPVHALRGVDLDIERGDYITITGSSGSGKSTLLHVMGALDRPTRGIVRLGGRRLDRLDSARLARIRGREIGFVFQSFNLYPSLPAWENVALPLMLRGIDLRRRKTRAIQTLRLVGLGDRTEHLPKQLSGGQRQRVAVARALAHEPAFVLADEPTGNLDSRSSEDILRLFDELHAAGRTLVVVTHDRDVARRSTRQVVLHDGKIVRDVHQTPGQAQRSEDMAAAGVA